MRVMRRLKQAWVLLRNDDYVSIRAAGMRRAEIHASSSLPPDTDDSEMDEVELTRGRNGEAVRHYMDLPDADSKGMFQC
jgi:hypothetical protein